MIGLAQASSAPQEHDPLADSASTGIYLLEVRNLQTHLLNQLAPAQYPVGE